MPDPNPKIEALRKQGSALRQRMFQLEEQLVAALRAEATGAAVESERRAVWEQLVKAVGPWSEMPADKRRDLLDILRGLAHGNIWNGLYDQRQHAAAALEAVPGLLRELQLDRYAVERNGARVIELEKQLRAPPSPDPACDQAELAEQAQHYREKLATDSVPGNSDDWIPPRRDSKWLCVPRRSWQMHARLRRACLAYFPDYHIHRSATDEHREVREATQALRKAGIKHPEDDPGPSFVDEQLMTKLDQLVQMIAATTGKALTSTDALDYAIGALRDLGTLAASYREPEELTDSTTIVHRAVKMHERWRKDHDELVGRRQQARAYSDELDRLAAAYRTPEDGELDCAITVDRAIETQSVLKTARGAIRSAEKTRDALVDELTRLCKAYQRPGEQPLAADVGVDRAIALQRRHQRKALEQPQPPAARIVADFFEKVTSTGIDALIEELDERGEDGSTRDFFTAAGPCATMLRGLLRLAYPEPVAS